MKKRLHGMGILVTAVILLIGWILWPRGGPDRRTESPTAAPAIAAPPSLALADSAQPLWPARAAHGDDGDCHDDFSSATDDVQAIDEPSVLPWQENGGHAEGCRNRVDLCVAPVARMDDSLSEAVDVPQLRPILPPAKMPPAEMDDDLVVDKSPAARSNEIRIAARPSNQTMPEAESERAPAAPFDSKGKAALPQLDQRQMDHVSQQADGRIREGYRLAKRGALYAARDEFIGALRTIAQALDLLQRTRSHSRALASGIRCLEESDDFIPSGTQMEADLDIAMIVGAHQTPILKDATLEEMTALGALQRYYTFAQEQLGSAVAGQPSGSIALCALGKLSVAMANEANSRSIAGPSKAVVFHQAALLAHAQNAEASNELGVLLARVGMYQAARDVLLESVSIFPQAANWHNLAVVQHHLGRDELASLAAAEAQKAQAVVNSRAQGTGTRTVGNYHVRVVSPAEFARTPQPAVATNASGPPDNRSGRR